MISGRLRLSSVISHSKLSSSTILIKAVPLYFNNIATRIQMANSDSDNDR